MHKSRPAKIGHMDKRDLPDLKAGDKLFVRRRWAHDKVSCVYDVDVIANDHEGTKVEIVIHYPGEAQRLTLFYSGRTVGSDYFATDFFRIMPSTDQIGCYSYRPGREIERNR